MDAHVVVTCIAVLAAVVAAEDGFDRDGRAVLGHPGELVAEDHRAAVPDVDEVGRADAGRPDRDDLAVPSGASTSTIETPGGADRTALMGAPSSRTGLRPRRDGHGRHRHRRSSTEYGVDDVDQLVDLEERAQSCSRAGARSARAPSASSMSHPRLNSVIDSPSPPAQSPTTTRVKPTLGCSARHASTSLSSAALLTA